MRLQTHFAIRLAHWQQTFKLITQGMADHKALHVCGLLHVQASYVRLVDLMQGSLGCTGARSKRKRVTSAVTVNNGCQRRRLWVMLIEYQRWLHTCAATVQPLILYCTGIQAACHYGHNVPIPIRIFYLLREWHYATVIFLDSSIYS